MNITLAVSRNIITKAREYAQKHKTTLNQIIRDYLDELVREEYAEGAADRFLRVCDRVAGDSHGWTWNREKVYEIE